MWGERREAGLKRGCKEGEKKEVFQVICGRRGRMIKGRGRDKRESEKKNMNGGGGGTGKKSFRKEVFTNIKRMG